MQYRELLPTDKPPFPFPKDANGAYPYVNLPQGVLSPDILMQEWYILCLKHIQKTYPEATISNDTGIAAITANGITVNLTNVMQLDYTKRLTTPEEQMNKAFGIVPVKPVIPSKPLPKEPFEEPVGSGKWYRYIIFDIKVACPAPQGVQPKQDVKTALKGYIGSELSKQPPKSTETIEFVTELLNFMDKL